MKPIDPPSEEVSKLQAAVAAVQALDATIAEHEAVFAEARDTVERFALEGDLRDLDAVASVATRRLQREFLERRLASLGEQKSQADTALDAANAAVCKVVAAELHVLKCAKAEESAQRFAPDYARIQEARRAALRSVKVAEIEARIYSVNNLRINVDGVELAEQYLALLAKARKEVAAAREKLGGEIPTMNELTEI